MPRMCKKYASEPENGFDLLVLQVILLNQQFPVGLVVPPTLSVQSAPAILVVLDLLVSRRDLALLGVLVALSNPAMITR